MKKSLVCFEIRQKISNFKLKISFLTFKKLSFQKVIKNQDNLDCFDKRKSSLRESLKNQNCW